MNPTMTPGVCRYCRVVDESAGGIVDGNRRSWWDKERTVCNASACITQFGIDEEIARRRGFDAYCRATTRRKKVKGRRVA